MKTFRRYLRDKCADPEFLKRYQDQCTICPKTVQIITAIAEQGLSNEAAARKAGVDPEHLALLESADRCSFDEVKKLSIALGLSLPDGCNKKASS
ncbi:MAG: helix-turn-helix domain-containing protein [Nitrospirae bacterium]|nr:helix-turn-helix domain-containing protein [Nitrospirota bacterium]